MVLDWRARQVLHIVLVRYQDAAALKAANLLFW